MPAIGRLTLAWTLVSDESGDTCLTLVSDESGGTWSLMSENPEILIGRDPSCDIGIRHESPHEVSRVQAKLVVKEPSGLCKLLLPVCASRLSWAENCSKSKPMSINGETITSEQAPTVQW
jgi:hypothetical protein